MLSQRAQQRRPGVRLQVEQLEDRCVPTTALTLPVSHTIQAAHSSGNGIPTKLSQVLTFASHEAKALNASYYQLRVSLNSSVMGSFSAQLLAQDIAVTRAENIAVNNLYRTFQRTKPAPATAYVRLVTMETRIEQTNLALQQFQLQETLAMNISPFYFSTKF
jgi:hypothetical protein